MIKPLYLVMLVLLAANSALMVSANADQVEPAQIKSQNLPVDSDLDGVIDEIDECYKTAPNTRVDERGCALVVKGLKEVRLNINFAYDSAVVTPEFYTEIEKVASFMNANPLTRVIIEGHSDSDGAATYNQRLSAKRAQAAARVLVSKFGIDAVRVTAVGFGEDRPLVANDTVANKARNRRVVAVIRSLKEKRG